MAAVPVQPDPTLSKLREVTEQRALLEEPRPYLGMSAIGGPCERALWYGFRWGVREAFDCDTLWRFDDGHRSEDVMAARLRLVPGISLRTIDPRTGRQFGFVDLGGHFRGHADGLISGLLQAPVVVHVWEGKAVGEAKQAKLAQLKAEVGEKNALLAWDPIYYAQAILYMAYGEYTRHYLTCASPGVRSIESVRTDSDLDIARRLRERAERVITAEEPLPKINLDPEWFECAMCTARQVCHGGKLPAVNCRTCVHATPEMDGDGRWSCAHHRRDLTVAEQRKGCAAHRYIPALVTFAEQIDANAEANWIEYRTQDGRTFRNGEPAAGCYSSEELRAADPKLLCDPTIDHIRTTQGGRLVEAA